jgi:hypothetical protein
MIPIPAMTEIADQMMAGPQAICRLREISLVYRQLRIFSAFFSVWNSKTPGAILVTSTFFPA